MAEGSRPIAKQYEGQRVSAIPDGFLQAYAQVGANIQNTGKALGEGIGGAIAAYKQNQQQHEIADGTAKAQFAKVGDINSYLDGQIKATPDEVKGKATDPNSTDPAVLAYRAIIEAKDTLAKDISGWTDKSLTGKTAALGRIAILDKFSEDWKTEEAKRVAGRTAAAQWAAEQAVREANATLAAKKERTATIGIRATGITAGARSELPVAKIDEKAGVIGVNPEFITAFSQAKAQVQAQIAATPAGDSQTLAALKSTSADLDTRFAQAVASTSSSQQAAIQETTAAAAKFADPTEAAKRLADIDGRIEELTKDRGGYEMLPKPVKDEIAILQKERNELGLAYEKAQAESKKTGKPVALNYQPTTFIQKYARDVNAYTAASTWEANMKAQDLPVTPEAKQWVYEMALYDGEVTSDGWKISVDKTTGALTRTRDPEFVRWHDSKAGGVNLVGEAAANFRKWQSDQAARNITASIQTFGIKTVDGMAPSNELFDMDSGRHSVFVKGRMLLDDTEALKVKKSIQVDQELMYSLGQIANLTKRRTADGKGVVYEQYTRPATEEEKKANPSLTTVTEDKIVDGYRIPVRRKISDMSPEEKQQFATAVATFIRIKAKGLGVLSKTDWDYLRTLAPDIGSQFLENANIKEDNAIKIVAQNLVSRATVVSSDFASRAEQQMKDVSNTMRLTLSSIPASGTASGKLEVSSGAATRVDGGRYYGSDLSNWWDTVTSAKTDGRTFNNDWYDLRADISVAYINRNRENGPSSGPEYYRQKLSELRAVLNHSGLDPQQIEQIVRKYTN